MLYKFLVGWNGRPEGKIADGSTLPEERIQRLLERGIIVAMAEPEPEPEPEPVVVQKPKGKGKAK